MENGNLREAVNDLTLKYATFQAKMTSYIAMQSNSSFPLTLEQYSSCPLSRSLTSSQPLNDSTPDQGAIPSSPAIATNNNVAASPAIVRPVHWIVQQADSTVKRLRGRAENLMQTTDLPPPPPSSSDVSCETDVEVLRRQLAEALAVIQEQDMLIHAGKIPALREKYLLIT